MRWATNVNMLHVSSCSFANKLLNLSLSWLHGLPQALAADSNAMESEHIASSSNMQYEAVLWLLLVSCGIRFLRLLVLSCAIPEIHALSCPTCEGRGNGRLLRGRDPCRHGGRQRLGHPTSPNMLHGGFSHMVFENCWAMLGLINPLHCYFSAILQVFFLPLLPSSVNIR